MPSEALAPAEETTLSKACCDSVINALPNNWYEARDSVMSHFSSDEESRHQYV